MITKEEKMMIRGICSLGNCEDCPLHVEGGPSWCIVATDTFKGKRLPQYEESLQIINEVYSYVYDKISSELKKHLPEPSKRLNLNEDDVLAVLGEE